MNLGYHVNYFSFDSLYQQLNSNNLIMNSYQVYFNNIKFTKNESDKIKSLKINLFVHGKFSVNIARDHLNSCNSWIYTQLINEFIISDAIGAKGLVVHLGKTKQTNSVTGKTDILTEFQAMNNMKNSIQYIIDQIEGLGTKLIIETSSGQGSETCYKLEDLSRLYHDLDPDYRDKVYFCIDTCHVFAAGYQLNIPDKCKEYFNKFNELIGLDKVMLIHFNDSKMECGSKRDRHQELNKGYIKQNGLIEVIKVAKNWKIPLVLETPGDLVKQINWIIELNDPDHIIN